MATSFAQKQLTSLETLNAQPISTISRRSNPALISSQATGLIHSTQQFQLMQSKTNDINKKILHNIETNQTLQTNILVDTLNKKVKDPINSLSEAIKPPLEVLTRLQQDTLDVTTQSVKAMQVAFDPETIANNISKNSSLLTFDREKVRTAQFNRGVGQEARVIRRLTKSFRTSGSAIVAFSRTAKQIVNPNMTSDEKKIALLAGLHDVARFSGQELISIRKGDRSNTFQSDLISASSRTFFQKITDNLQTTPILAPLIEVGKFVTKLGKFAITPTSLLTSKSKNKSSRFSSGSDLATKSGLDLDHRKGAYQFLSTTFPNIAEESKTVLYKQLGVQENIQSILEDTLSVLSGSSVKKTINNRDFESKVYDPFLGEYITREESIKLATKREKQAFNTRRRERNVFSRIFGIGKKDDINASKNIQDTVVNKQKQYHNQSQSNAKSNAVDQDKKLINTLELVSRGALLATVGPVGSLLASFAAKYLGSKVTGDTLIEEVKPKFGFKKSKQRKTDKSPDLDTNFPRSYPTIVDSKSVKPLLWQQTIINELPKQTMLLESRGINRRQSNNSDQSDTRPTISDRLKSREAKTDKLSRSDNILEVLKNIDSKSSSPINTDKKRHKSIFRKLFGLLSIGVGSVFSLIKSTVGSGLSGLIGGLTAGVVSKLPVIVGMIGAFLTNPLTWASLISIGTNMMLKKLGGIVTDIISTKKNTRETITSTLSTYRNRIKAKQKILDVDKKKGASKDQLEYDNLVLNQSKEFFAEQSARSHGDVNGNYGHFEKAMAMKPKMSKLYARLHPKPSNPAMESAKSKPKTVVETKPLNQVTEKSSNPAMKSAKSKPKAVVETKPLNRVAEKPSNPAMESAKSKPKAVVETKPLNRVAEKPSNPAMESDKVIFFNIIHDLLKRHTSDLSFTNNPISNVYHSKTFSNITRTVSHLFSKVKSYVPYESPPSLNINDLKPNHHLIHGGSDDIKTLIHSTSNKYGVPESLVNAIVKTESDFNPNDRSPVGAMGLMQLMPATAKDLHVSDPFDPAQNLDGGVRYIRTLLTRYDGNLVKALAAYNWGMGNVERKHLDHMPPETRNYISKITGLLSSGNNIAFNSGARSSLPMSSPTNQTVRIDTNTSSDMQKPSTTNVTPDVSTSLTSQSDTLSSLATILDTKLTSVVMAISKLVSSKPTQINSAPVVKTAALSVESDSLTSIVDNLFSSAPISVSNQAVSFSGII